MHDQPTTLVNLAVERVVERAAQDRSRPGQHTLVMDGTANERRSVLDRIEGRLRYRSPGTPPHIGRVQRPLENATGGAAALWDEVAGAAGLNETDHVHASGLGRIQNAAGERPFVAIIDDLDAVLAGWNTPGEALNLRWALQNVNGLMVIAATKGPIGTDASHEHAILAMTFAIQNLQAHGVTGVRTENTGGRGASRRRAGSA